MDNKTKEAYIKTVNHLDKEIILAKSLDEVNKLLIQYNLALLHPYSQGFELEYLKRIIKESKAPFDDISIHFGKRFLNLTYTISLIEGYFSFRPYIIDYILSIKESLMLCLQKDFKAAIYTIIPAIEGILRNFLIATGSKSYKTTTKISELLKAFDMLTDNYISIQKGVLVRKGFDKHQIENVLKKHREYFVLWVGQLKTYLSNNLYLNTKFNEISDTINRHVIFHSFEQNIDFSFHSFIRLFHCISYLSWAIGLISKECSVFNVADDSKVKKEWSNYMTVLYISEATGDLKGVVLNKKLESFKKYLTSEYIKVLSRPENKMKKVLNQFDMEKFLYLS